ncbi:MAG TPA: lysylphosphatidylglycerol synthase transmembrane domain-containing protein [Thermomicrobiales bacterium]|nr:lysylphosphatidylglycerol synthase transmembrane domain-containing protein [Thermomicrobiales bacterium]
MSDQQTDRAAGADRPDGAAEPATAQPAGGPLMRSLRRAAHIPTPIIFLVSLGLALALVWKQGRSSEIVADLRRIDPAFIVGVLAIYAIGPALQCVRWDALARMVGAPSRLQKAAELFLTSVIVNYAAPIGLAVPTRAALTKRDLGLSTGASGAVVVWEALLDMACLGALALVWLAFGDLDVLHDVGRNGREAEAVGIVAVAGAAIVALILWRSPRARRRLKDGFASLGRFPLQRPRRAAEAALLSVGYWLLQGVVLWMLLGALGVRADAMLVIGLLGLPVLAGMLSPLPGGAGVREALMVGVARAQGVDATAVLVAAVAYRVALFLTVPLLFAIVRFVGSGPGRALRRIASPRLGKST